MKILKWAVSILGVALLFHSCRIFKKPEPKTNPAMVKTIADSTKKAPTKLKPYSDIITKKAISQNGLFKVHKVEEKYFFEIPNSLLETDLLIVNRISKGASGASGGMFGYAGDQVNENVVQFAKGPNYKLFLKSISYTERSADSTDNGMYRSVSNSGLQPIVASFDIKAVSKDSSAMVIDVTDYISSDNEVLFFDPRMKSGLKLSALQADKSYISSVNAHANNIEIRSVKTYSKTPEMVWGKPIGGGNATYEMNSSIVLLPKKPMPARLYDNRVGYFATGYVDFDADPQGVKQTAMVTRWRLEPKDADRERYLKGDLVEPKEQIVFYIDPATPKKWVPYLIAGVNDWNIAFEQAGFKNAIVAKEAPTKAQDSTWSIDDARHSVIVYKPSAIANAMGPHVHDPRTGEILESHISWYHNVMQLLRNWYLVQAAAVDPKARKMKFDDELMGQLIRFVSSHEVGHTLGLRHNFGSSSTVPVEKLRDKAWVEANGHTPSIMDYARFNYVAQPEDGIGEKGLFPRINDYDKWAIEWGYRWWPEMPRAEETAKLNKWIIERTSGNKRLWFGTESDPDDPRCQNEDLGDDAMKAGAYGIKNLKRILPQLKTWTKVNDEGYNNLGMMYNETLGQFRRYVSHVQKNIGGVLTTPKTVEQSGAVYENVAKEKQKRAVAFIQQQLFSTPLWVLDKQIMDVVRLDPVDIITKLQAPSLSYLMSAMTISKLINAQAKNSASAYTAPEYLNDVKAGIWAELPLHKTIDVYRRNLQQNHLKALIKLSFPEPVASPPDMPPGSYAISLDGSGNADVGILVKVQMKALQKEIRATIGLMKDKMTRYHLQDCLDKLNEALKPKKV